MEVLKGSNFKNHLTRKNKYILAITLQCGSILSVHLHSSMKRIVKTEAICLVTIVCMVEKVLTQQVSLSNASLKIPAASCPIEAGLNYFY